MRGDRTLIIPRARTAGLQWAWNICCASISSSKWFNLSDPGAEEALYDSQTLCAFVGIDLGREPVPDETTILKFRHLLEKHHLGKKLFQEVHRHLESQGINFPNMITKYGL